jgi:predicted nucleic acid-binding protein
MQYVDTSVLVAAFTNERRTSDIQIWLGRQDLDELMISEWSRTEFSAALSIKLRTGQIKPDERSTALASFARLTLESLSVVPVDTAHFRTAARLSDQSQLGLRAGDSLHLAIAADRGATVETLDMRLAKAGAALGVRTHLL